MLRGLRWIALSLSGIAPAPATAMDAIPPEKAVITLTPKFGPVTFGHQRHSELDAVHCFTCHHTMNSDGEAMRSCYSCHEARYYSVARVTKGGQEQAGEDGTGPQVPNAQQAFHDLCTGCHKHRRERKLPAGPDDSCRDCHK